MSAHSTTHRLSTGEEIVVTFSKFMSTHIMRIEVNFNPYEHVEFGYQSITSLDGVSAITGIQSAGKSRGVFSFLVRKDVNIEELIRDIVEQFTSYFIQF